MEMLLRMELAEPALSFDLAGVVIPHASALDPVMQFWTARLIRAFPAPARSRFDLAFFFEGPPRPRLPSRTAAQAPAPAVREERLIAFDWNPKLMFRPRFCSSSRLEKMHARHIMDTRIEDHFLVVDATNTIGIVALPGSGVDAPPSLIAPMPLHKLQESVTASCALPEEPAVVLGFESGGVWKYDLQSRQGTQIASVAGGRTTAIDALSGAAVLVGAADGTLSLIDLRECGRPARSVAFQDFLALSAITIWPNGCAAAALGFHGGAATIFDLRMWMPIWSDKTGPVARILPMGLSSPGLSYLTMNEDIVEIIIESRAKPLPKPRVSLTYRERGGFRHAFSYRAGAIVIDDQSASFVHAGEGTPIYRLLDRAAPRLRIVPNDLGDEIEMSQKGGPSVHKHEGVVVCGTVVKDAVVTCDDLGFIHRWEVGLQKRKG
jgi:hypothetical protein